MSTFATVEVESSLGALLLFLWGEFLWEFDHINVHGVGVSSGLRGGREGLESLG